MRCHLIVVFALAICTAGSAQASMIIDAFQSGSQYLSVYTGKLVDTNIAPVLSGSVSQFRDSALQRTTGTSSFDAALDTTSGMNFTQSSAGTAIATVVWDNNNIGGIQASYSSGLDLNMLAGGDQGIQVLLNASHGDMSLEFTLFTDGNANATKGTLLLSGDHLTPYTAFLPYTAFSTVSGTPSLANVDAVQLVITGSAGGDVSVSGVATAVPEPATWLLALLALPAYCVWRRR